jgi:hypothetical protein
LGNTPSENLSLIKRILVGWLFWELNPEVLGLLWLKVSVIWVRKSLQLKASMIGEAGHALSNYTLALALQLRKITENLSG